jgi:RNA recognition motif-containing protein
MRDGAGRFTGIAFIRCPSKEEAGRLIQSMNNLDIGGRNIQVEFKKKKKKKGEGMSSDSDFSNCSSLRSSAEYLNYNPEEATEPPRGKEISRKFLIFRIFGS